MSESCILVLQCDDRSGLVADVTALLAKMNCNITDSQQFNDKLNGRFFMRMEFDLFDRENFDNLRDTFSNLALATSMDWSLRRRSERLKVLFLVSKFHHCLVDLLFRFRIGDLPMDPVGVISNHPKEVVTEALIGEIPFHHLPISKDTKPQQEAQIKAIIEKTGADLVVLARYMQILSDDLASFLNGRCINIHHSFLPGFKGAKPYHQAWERGVKMIGATAHYVTADLDEGPIIHQAVEPISHADSPEDLVRKGSDIERNVLATALRHHLEGRVFFNGTRTVVFKA